MGEVVDGVELLKMSVEGRLKEGTEIIQKRDGTNVARIEVRNGYLYNINSDKWVNAYDLKTHIFEIIEKEEDEEIDIDSIEEVKHIYIYNLDPNVEKVDDRVSTNVEKINELIKAVKQLNKRTE